MSRDPTPLIRVEVACALPDRQALIALELKAGSTVRDAVEHSGIRLQFPGIEVTPGRVGVFGKVVPLETPLQDGDRVEIYRPLKVDPKEARRQRAKRSRK